MGRTMETQQTAASQTISSTELAAHMHLVLGIVADFMRRVPRSVQREDLIAAGSIGLLQALRSQKHTCPEMLIAYARIRIRGAVIDELRRHDWSPRRRRSPSASVPSAAVAAPANDAPSNAEKSGVVVIGFEDLPPTHALSDEGPSPLEQVESHRSGMDLRHAIEQLPPRERSIILMRYFDDIPSKSIASKLGLSEARISQLLARATSQLKQHLADRPEELALAA